MTYRQRIAEHIRILLELHGYRNQDLAFALGYTASWTSKVLTGERPVSTDDIPRVADFFHLTVDQFIAPGLSAMTDRRRGSRRKSERRKRPDRRHLDTRTWSLDERRRALAHEDPAPAAPRREWTQAEREAAAVKMKGDPLSEAPSRHGEYFRPAGAGKRRASGKTSAATAEEARRRA